MGVKVRVRSEVLLCHFPLTDVSSWVLSGEYTHMRGSVLSWRRDDWIWNLDLL